MKRWGLTLVVFTLGITLITAPAQAQLKPGWPKGATIGTSGIGGVYFVWGGGFAKLLNDKVGVQASVEVTAGPVANVKLVADKQLDFGLATAAPIYEGWLGQGWAKGVTYQNVRVIFPMFTSYAHAYAPKKTGIKDVKDLNGKAVGIGAVGTTPAVYWPIVFDVVGVKPGRTVNAGWSDLTSQMKDGMIDAVATISGLPWGSLTEMEVLQEMHVFALSKEQMEQCIAKYPYLSPGVIRKGTYKANKDVDLHTVTVWNFMVVHKDAPDDFIYEVVRKTYENVDILIAAHPSAQEVQAQAVVNSPIPLHPGALKYYQEKGISIPEKLIPK
jgi:uncharacterized protein